jgi:hypothetical protein
MILLVAVLTAAACAPPPAEFDPAGARAHVQALADGIGPRPHGSAAATRARNYIADQLRAMGFAVRIQEADAVDARRGLTARVRNVIAVREGEVETGIALVSHYDSRPRAPGAIDDALGVATSLEAARLLGEDALRHSLFVLVTDAEEIGTMGARALVADPEVLQRVGAFLNFDAAGGAGPFVLFEAGGGSTLTAWARGAAAPMGTSLGTEVYRHLPNDTDFTILKSLGVDGVNFAPVGDSYAYHTDRDTPARVRDATLAHGLASAVTTVRALDALPFTMGADEVTYFDVARQRGVVYGAGAAVVVTIAGAVLGAIAWLLLGVEGRRRAGLRALASTAVVAVLVLAAGAGGLLTAGWVVSAVRVERLPWHAAPAFYLMFVASAGALAAWSAARLSRLLPARLQPWRHPGAVWWVVLPLWAIGGIAVQAAAPGASYLITVPLLLTSIAVLLSSRSTLALRVTSGLALAAASVLWVGDTVRLLDFVAPLFSRLSAPPPPWFFPAVLGAVAFMLAPPAIALVAGRAPVAGARRMLLVLSMLVALAGGLALGAPAYNETRPERRALLYFEDVARQEAWWEIAGIEPTSELGGGPDGAGWTAMTDEGGSRHRASALSATNAPPAAITADVQADADGTSSIVTITIVPRGLVTAEVRLPPGAPLVESSLAGRRTPIGWSATHAAVPAEGLTVRLIFGAPPEEVPELHVALTTGTVPGGATRDALPSWLPTRRSSWSARAVYIVPVPPLVRPSSGDRPDVPGRS